MCRCSYMYIEFDDPIILSQTVFFPWAVSGPCKTTPVCWWLWSKYLQGHIYLSGLSDFVAFDIHGHVELWPWFTCIVNRGWYIPVPKLWLKIEHSGWLALSQRFTVLVAVSFIQTCGSVTKSIVTWSQEQRKKDVPNIPSTIGQELTFNPFMRVK